VLGATFMLSGERTFMSKRERLDEDHEMKHSDTQLRPSPGLVAHVGVRQEATFFPFSAAL
jgi:hypothetical protein